MVTPADIAEASRRIAGRVRVTPVMNLEDGSFASAGHLVVKLELNEDQVDAAIMCDVFIKGCFFCLSCFSPDGFVW